MPINPPAILAHKFPPISQNYTARDAILYALGIGLGQNPVDPIELGFLLETDLKILPTMSVTLATPGMWVRAPEFGINVAKLVHAAQAAVFHKPLPPMASITAQAEIISLADRGEARGAILVLERRIYDAADNALYCTLRQTLLLRGDGGFGGPAPESEAATLPPERPADITFTFAIPPRAALIYRLSGDWNPLHADPAAAARAGFERPILHGLASYGIAGWAILRACAEAEPAALCELAMRFSGVVYPGDTMTLQIWRDASQIFFQGHVGDRKVLDQGFARLRTG